jgi:elongation factor G
MRLDVVTPEINMGDIIGDLNRRRGQIDGMEDKAGSKLVKARVPLSEMFGYVTDLRTMSSGRATSTMEFASFETAPKNIAEAVIAETTGVQQ